MTPTSYLRVALLLPLLASTQDPKPERVWLPTAEHQTVEIEGFTLLVDPRLAKDSELWPAVQKELASQLWQLARRVPPGALAKLRQVRIFVEAESKTLCAAYHPSRRWLEGHGYNPDMARCVEIGNPTNFLGWTRQQPWMLLHELAHAYHHQFLPGGFGNAELREAYAKAKAGQRYEQILHVNGKTVRHYAMNNEKEYFAEASEAFFGTNDMYPFVRGELKAHDPALFRLLERLWQG